MNLTDKLQFLLIECGSKRLGVATLVAGDTKVIENEYPWVVAIYQSTKQICGGTIISKSHVLSGFFFSTISCYCI